MAEVKSIAILYHADCPDGFGAAWAAWKKFGGKALYLPVRHNDPPPEESHGKAVYAVDFCYGEEVLKKFLPKVKSFTAIDHHISRRDAVARLNNGSVYDLNHSGAVLAWKYFHPKKKVPKLLLHIEDMDLWRFRLPRTRELVEFLDSYDFDFALFDKLARGCEKKEVFKRYIMDGQALARHVDKEAKKALKNAEEITFEGYKCLMANSSSHASYVGHKLVDKMPPIAVVWSRRGGKIVVSLRSNGTVDVAKIAQKYGGGGHQAAAGFSFEVKDFLNFQGRASAR